MVAELPADPDERAGLGGSRQPVHGRVRTAVPPAGARAGAGPGIHLAPVRRRAGPRRGAARRRGRLEALVAVRAVLGPLEADSVVRGRRARPDPDPERVAAFGTDAGRRILDALDRVDRASLPA